MGGVANSVSGLFGGGNATNPINKFSNSALDPVTGAASNTAGQILSTIPKTIIASGIGQVPLANQTDAQNQINYSQLMANNNTGDSQNYLRQANSQFGNVQNAIDTTQGSINNAQQVAQWGNQSNAIDLLKQQAEGTAPSAAQAQLTAGNNQAIAQQHALANSGNLSQMIGGQKAAMDNAAQLAQSNANAATQLQATQQQVGQQNYASAAAQQAAQVAQNANLQQQQAAQQANLYGTQLGTGTNLAGTAANAQGQATTGQLGALGIQQDALKATGQNQAAAAGGLMNAIGGGASAMLGVAHGGKIPGKVKGGDKTSNDTVPAMLSSGEIVIPVSALKSKDKAIKFLLKVMEGKDAPEPRKLSAEEIIKLKKKAK